jgi:1-acyl-sn-glycerol-3-phosphate acyltransferase
MIRTAIVAILIGLYTLIVGPFLLLHAWITGNPDFLFHAGLAGVYATSYIVGLRIRVEGLERIPPRVCLFLANHTSFVDALPIVWAIPRRIGILAKKSLFSLPLIGFAFRQAKFVPVDRANREAAIISVDLAAERMKEGISFLAYPEGTRSYDGRLLPFKKGVFVMAIKAGVPIIPMVCIGAHRIMAKMSLKIHPGVVVVRFGDPIAASEYTLDNRDVLARRVWLVMAELLPPDQQPLDLQRWQDAQQEEEPAT